MVAESRQSIIRTGGKWEVVWCKIAVVWEQIDRTVESGREVGSPQNRSCAGARGFKLTCDSRARHLR